MSREASYHVEADTNSMLQNQEAHSVLLNEIRLNQLQMNDIREEAVVDAPIWIVTIGRNPEFVGRKSIIGELRERLEPTSDFVRKAVLCGLGGVGVSDFRNLCIPYSIYAGVLRHFTLPNKYVL